METSTVSTPYKVNMCALLKINVPTPARLLNTVFQFVSKLRGLYIHNMTQDDKRLTEAELLHSRAGSDCGRGKIRYIGRSPAVA